MKPNLSLWQFAGYAVTTLGGTLLHFLYDWTGRSIFVAPFAGVNESTWEHMKLLFFPMFIFALVQSRFFTYYKNFWCVKLAGIVTGLLLIPVVFYTANGVFGTTPDWFNIFIFFLSAAGAYLLETWIFKKNRGKCSKPLLPLGILCLIALLFVIFTFAVPQIPLFQDPLTGTYGR